MTEFGDPSLREKALEAAGWKRIHDGWIDPEVKPWEGHGYSQRRRSHDF